MWAAILRPGRVPIGFWLMIFLGSPVWGEDRMVLKEKVEVGQSARVSVTLTARGSRPEFDSKGEKRVDREPGPNVKPGALPPSFPFQFDSQLSWLERVRSVGPQGRIQQAVRRLERAEATIDSFRGAGQKMVVGVRPDLSLVLAERRGAGVMLISTGGPLTRSELDLIQTVGDPALLGELLPTGPVVVGDRWDLDSVIAAALSEYDQITTNTLRAKLEALDARAARFSLVGEVRGSVRGATGSVALTGEAIFDRQSGLVSRLQVERAEARQAGPVESALEVKSTLTVERTPISVPVELSDAALEGLPLESSPERELLLLEPPDGAYALLHDRAWHIINDSVRRVVLRRMRGGNMEAQCDLITGPNAGRGRHQDLTQFRDDIRKGLRAEFADFVGEGEVGGGKGGGFRYKLGVQGNEKDHGLVPLWYYYLVAGPEGDQVVAIFTLNRDVEPQFGDQDERMIGTLEWKPAGAKASNR